MGRGASCADVAGASLLYGPSQRRLSTPGPEPIECDLPRMTKVASSNLAEVGFRAYKAGSETGDLFIRFKDGALFRWESVEAVTYARLMAAESKGRFLHHSIKGLYPSTKLN